MARLVTTVIAPAALGLTTAAAAWTAWAVDGQGAWRYSADAGPRHVARVEDAGRILAYGCDARTGRSIAVELRRSDGSPVTRAGRGVQALSFVFTSSGSPGSRQQIDATALPSAIGPGVVVREPAANGLLLVLLEGRYDSVTIAANDAVHSFPLVGAATVIRQANLACSTSLPPTPAATDEGWRTFSYGGLFEIDMPGGAEAIDSTIPTAGSAIRYGGLRGSDGHATYTAIVSDSGAKFASDADRVRFFDEFIAGTVDAASRNGTVSRDPPPSAASGLVADVRIAHANGTTQFMRVAMRETRLYILTATCRADPRTIARKDRFVASFRPL